MGVVAPVVGLQLEAELHRAGGGDVDHHRLVGVAGAGEGERAHPGPRHVDADAGGRAVAGGAAHLDVVAAGLREADAGVGGVAVAVERRLGGVRADRAGLAHRLGLLVEHEGGRGLRRVQGHGRFGPGAGAARGEREEGDGGEVPGELSSHGAPGREAVRGEPEPMGPPPALPAPGEPQRSRSPRTQASRSNGGQACCEPLLRPLPEPRDRRFGQRGSADGWISLGRGRGVKPPRDRQSRWVNIGTPARREGPALRPGSRSESRRI